MKTVYEVMGFIGFIIMIGGAGGADSVGFGTVFGVMASGLFIMLCSMLLIKSHNMRMKKRKYLRMRKKVEYRAPVQNNEMCRRKTSKGISLIVSGKINSPELC